MELVTDLKSLKNRAAILALFTIFFLIAPGIAGIYLYSPEYIAELDAVKLILLSITCTMPLAVVNALTIGFASRRKRQRDDDLFYDFVFGTLASGVLLYAAVIVAHLSNWSMRQLGELVLVGEAAVILGLWLYSRSFR